MLSMLNIDMNNPGYKQKTKWEERHTKIVQKYEQRVRDGSIRKIRISNKD